jgi:hypothetical protein
MYVHCNRFYYRNHAGNLSGIPKESPKALQGIFKEHLGSLQGVFNEYASNLKESLDSVRNL